MRGNLPEEDGVEHRAEPQSWLADGAADGADARRAEDQPYPADQVPKYSTAPAFAAESADDVSGLGTDHPNGILADTAPPLAAEVGRRPPYPSQAPPTRSLGARMAAPFLGRSRTGAADPARPAQGGRSRPMTARITAPFQGRSRPAAARPP